MKRFCLEVWIVMLAFGFMGGLAVLAQGTVPMLPVLVVLGLLGFSIHRAYLVHVRLLQKELRAKYRRIAARQMAKRRALAREMILQTLAQSADSADGALMRTSSSDANEKARKKESLSVA